MNQFKKTILEFIPPILRKILIKIRTRNSYPKFDISYWNKNKKFFNNELIDIVDSYLDSADFKSTTKYWRYLLRRNLEQLNDFGIENYGNYLARNYFTWTDFTDSNVKNLIRGTENSEDVKINVLKIHNGFSLAESIKHNLLILLLLNDVLKKGNLKSVMSKIDSKGYLFGNHPFLESKYGELTLDKLSSVLEVESLEPIISENSKILEIGAGSGRTANAILSLYPNCKYVIADIPPASFVAMSRLRHAFPEKRISFATNMADARDLILRPNSWDILFILPSMLEEIPNKFFDLTLAIDCLHEMNLKMRLYFARISEQKSFFYYIKIWNSTIIPFDNIELSSKNLQDFGCKGSWNVVLSKECDFPSNFSEFLFRV